MAAALQSFRFTVRSCCCQTIAYRYTTRYTTKAIGRRRTFSSSPFRRQEDENEEPPPELSKIEEKANRDHGANYRIYLEDDLQGINEEVQEAMDHISVAIEQGSAAPEEMEDIKMGKRKRTFLNMGETEDFEEEEDNDDAPDISSIAHGELEAHREKRHYARLAAWEMPLLSKMAKPFEPPTADMPLRFRYTTYMGEQHPSEKKVVLEFCPGDMPLTKLQKVKLKKLVGVRYNPQTDIIKMSCEMFESQAQNKRYLGDRVDELLKEAKDPTDTFKDVPLDLRHHVVKIKPKFPASWRMTAERQLELAQIRAANAARDQQRMLQGGLVNGVTEIEVALARVPELKSQEIPLLVMAGKGARGQKSKRVGLRR